MDHLIGKELVKLANESSLIRSYLGIENDWKNIIKITPDSVHRVVGYDRTGRPIFNANFVGSRKYKGVITTNQMINLIEEGGFKNIFKSLEKRYGQKIWDSYYAFHHLKGLKQKDLKAFSFATTGDLKPAVGANSPADGVTAYDPADTTWANVRGGAGDYGSPSGSSESARIAASTTLNLWAYFQRLIFMWNTSSIGAGQVCSAADLKLRGQGKTDAFSQSLVIVSSAPASAANVVAGDYDSTGTTAFATGITLATFSTAGYNTFALNASGLANIDMAGVSKFAAVMSGDQSNTEPAWSSGTGAIASVYMADNGSLEPILNVTYAPADLSNLKTLDGLVKASVKMVNGLPIISVKSRSGLT